MTYGGGHKLRFVGNTKILKGGILTNQVKRLFDEQKFQKGKVFLEGSGHPNFMNPIEYDKSLPGKSFSKRIRTLTAPNPKMPKLSEYYKGGFGQMITVLHYYIWGRVSRDSQK